MLTTLNTANSKIAPRLRAYWQALRATRSHRLVQPGTMLHQQILTEPLAGNLNISAEPTGRTAVPWRAACRT